ncbi:MAG TPA: amino acid adenylation domain-containing protein [Thermodesulfobacteriota bacterium]|nr:amino acid adenylation domain-containing protein [Thermodesulfobacteriota bacterium]
METIVDLFEDSFTLYPLKPAVRIYADTWTYNDLRDLSSQIAHFLLESGMKRGDRVVVLMNKSIYLYAAMIGIMQGGGIYVPLDARTPSARLARILEDIVPFRIFIDHHSSKHYPACQKLLKAPFKVLYLDDYRKEPFERINLGEKALQKREEFPSVCSEDLASILYTSGSTGVPKGAMITHGNLYHIVRYTIKAFDYGPEEVGSALSANAFDGSLLEMLPILCSGGTLGAYPEERIFVRDILELTYNYGITKMFLVPSTLSSFVNSSLMRPESLCRMKDILFGGESTPINTLIKIMSLLPHVRFHNLYGPTETAIFTSKYSFRARPNLRTKILSIGFPFANNRYLLDRTDFKDEKMKGELLIAGPQVGAGYWRDPEKTKHAFGVNDEGERFYRTGDVASFNPRIGYFIHGRKDHQIKFMGYRIELGEIEQTLSLLPLVRENVVIPVYVKGRIEELRLIYSGDGDSDQEIRKHLNKHLPPYMIPKSLIRVESLPKNQNNKIDRVLIKEMYAGK